LLDAENFMSWEKEVPVKLHVTESGPLSEKPISVMTALKTTAENYPHHPALGLYACLLYYLQLLNYAVLYWFINIFRRTLLLRNN